jgi:hypothetical protein
MMFTDLVFVRVGVASIPRIARSDGVRGDSGRWSDTIPNPHRVVSAGGIEPHEKRGVVIR